MSILFNESTARTSQIIKLDFQKKNGIPISNTKTPDCDQVSFSDETSNSMMGKWQYQSPNFKVRGLKLVFANSQIGWEGTIRSIVSKIAVRASIEYPAGVFTPVFFDGIRDTVIQSGGISKSGVADVVIPANTNYWVRVYTLCQAGNLKQLPTSGVMYSTGGGGVNIGKAGSAAAATASVSGGLVTNITLTGSGSGYPPNTEITCSVTGGGGTGADVRAFVSETGLIENKFRIVDPGTGYATAPTIGITGNDTGAVAYQAIPLDLTASGSLAQNINFSGYGPSSIIGIPADSTIHRSYLAIGDSITAGYYDSYAGYGGWAKRVSETYQVPIINFGISGGSAQVTWDSDSKNWSHFPIFDGITDVIVALGTNDLQNSRTQAQIQADITSLVERLQDRGLDVSLCTIPPLTDSSNVPKAFEAIRVAVNTWIRTQPINTVAVYDTADALETARNSGVWKASHFYVSGGDLIHPNSTGFDAMAVSFLNILK